MCFFLFTLKFGPDEEVSLQTDSQTNSADAEQDTNGLSDNEQCDVSIDFTDLEFEKLRFFLTHSELDRTRVRQRSRCIQTHFQCNAKKRERVKYRAVTARGASMH